jgi:hypothetical protein
MHARTREATHTVNPSVQVDDVAAPCPLVESVHILGYQQFDMTALLELCQGKVCRIGQCIAYQRPALPGARPVPAARMFVL